MSASSSSSKTNVEDNVEQDVPQLSALFLIRFDRKVGYTVAWKRSSVDVLLDGAVEFKSLPSGLHAVKSDLVYFVHEEYAGLSAFVNGPASEAERNAQFVAVGGLVPLSYGRLGRSWLVAGKLEKIARTISENPDNTTPLEEFWEQQSKPQPSSSTPKPEQYRGHSRARALSTVTAAAPSDLSLPPYHPARAIVQYIELFGPLVFRLQQAAILRKRILFVGAPPVRATCELVYNLSLLASIPTPARSHLPTSHPASFRLRSLFSLGIHDIPFLESLRSTQYTSHTAEAGSGWVACTTDEIIATKPHLYDIIVELPSPESLSRAGIGSRSRKWPSVKTSDGLKIKASQRDVWRYKLLHHELWRYAHPAAVPESDAEADDQTGLLDKGEAQDAEEDFADSYDDKSVEASSWSRLAYNGFMWWASAGEQDISVQAERDRDRELLGDLGDFEHGVEEAVIAYFHRCTLTLFKGIADVVDSQGVGSEVEEQGGNENDDRDGGEDGHEDEDELENKGIVRFEKDDVSRLGLDAWSEADCAFLTEVVYLYWGVRSEVGRNGVDVCGVRLPC